MNKILKILISILIAISMVLNPLTVTSSALGGAGVAFGEWFVDFIISRIIYSGANHIWNEFSDAVVNDPESVVQSAEFLDTMFLDKLLTSEDIIQVEYDYDINSHSYVVTGCFVSPTYTGEESGRAHILCNAINSYLNDGGNPDLVFNDMFGTGIYSCDSFTYAELKNKLFNYYVEQAAISTGELAEAGNFPVYSFDFVGPLPSMTVPTSEGLADLSVDGFKLTVPTSSMVVRELNGNLTYFFTSEEAARAAGCTSVTKMFADDNGLEYWSGSIKATAYGGGNYILYDGVVYYLEGSYYGSPRDFSVTLEVNQSQFSRFVSLDGVALSDVYSGGSISVGAVFNTTNEIQAAVPSKSISESDFITSVGGTFEIPRTDEEKIIGNGIELGLVNPDSTISFDESGNITAVDDIEIAKLEELIEKISAGNLELEDIQSYLDLITKLVSSGNMTATEQMIILDNIATLTEIQNKDISDIKNSVKSIADSITAEGAAEDVDSDFGYLQINHHGLIESQTIINTAFPFVAQSQQLINNLFDYSSNSTDIPNFSFYWDSNKDGIQERYTLLDLSFMEQVLTNDNLEDKNRFMKSMTIREFVQALIVLVIYVGFSIKFLRKLPGLFGSAESVSDNAISKR